MTDVSEKKVILILEANPQGTDALGTMAEVRAIRELFEHRGAQDQFDLKIYPRVTRNDFVAAIGRYKPAVVHFIGHASSSALCLENQRGHSDLLTHDAVIGVLSDYANYIDCVIFNACNTERHAQAASEFIPTVIGTCGAIETATAACYAERFYQGLFDNNSFQRGHSQAGAAIGSEVELYRFYYTAREKQNQLKDLKGQWRDYEQLRQTLKPVLPQGRNELRALCRQCFPAGQMGLFPQVGDQIDFIDWVSGRSLSGFNPPLLYLVALLLDQFDGDDGLFLGSWLNDFCEEIGILPTGLIPYSLIPEVAEQDKPIYVLIEIAPIQVNSNKCTVQAWIYLGENTELILTCDAKEAIDLKSEESKSQFIDDLVEALSDSEYLPHSNHEQIILEFILPMSLLSLEIDQWSDLEQQVLGKDYRITVRPQERIRKKRLQRFWKSIPSENIKLSDCSKIVDPAELDGSSCEQLLSDARQDSHSIIFKSPTDSDLLTKFIRQGLPVILWPRLSPKEMDNIFCMNEVFGERSLTNLPKTVQKIRDTNTNQLGQHLTLLWDDKDRLPPEVSLQSPG